MKGRMDLLRIAPLVAVIAVLLFSGCTANGEASAEDLNTITLYMFSVPGEVLEKEIVPAFIEHWKAKTGKTVKFETSIAGSGTVTNQIMGGAPAEVAILSHELDAIRLREANKTATDWRTFDHKGIISKTPFIIMTRKGNPKDIRSFEDLTKEGVEVIQPDPASSGAAMWGVYAEYGGALKEHDGNATHAVELLRGIRKNLVAMPDSARKALTTFDTGVGDALVTYENEYMLKKKNGEGDNYEVVMPRSTIYSEHPIVIIDVNVAPVEREMIGEFVNFMWTEESQKAQVEYGFRSVDDSITKRYGNYTDPELGFSIEYLGGWEKAKADLIDEIWQKIQIEN